MTLAMALIVATWSLLVLVLIGVGYLIRSFFRPGTVDPDDAFRCFWVGFAASLTFLQIWHFWHPIDGHATAAFAGIGVLGLVFGWRDLSALLKACLKRTSIAFAVLLAVIVIWSANRAAGPVDNPDSGNYHLPVIRWSTSYPIVRGLGNVDGHFAFNNSSLLYQAMLEVGFWHGRSSHIGNGLLLVGLTLFFLVKTRDLILNARAHGPGLLYPAVVLTPLMYLSREIASPSPDLPAASIAFVIGWMLLVFARDRETQRMPVGRSAFHLFAGTFLCAVAVSVKLSNAFYAGSACLVFLGLWLRNRDIPLRDRRRIAAVSFAVVLAVGSAWATRNVVLSGYPFFPSLAMETSVAWRIPRVFAEWYGWFITTWARAPQGNLAAVDGIAWVPGWITELMASKIAGLLPLLLTSIAIAYLATRRRRGGVVPRAREIFPLVTWLPAMVAVPAWFILAPGFRFGIGILWVLAAQALSLLFSTMWYQSRKASLAVLFTVAALPVLILAYQVGMESRSSGSFGRAVATRLWVSSGPDHGMHPLHRTPMTRVVTSYGVTAYQPSNPECPILGAAWRDCLMWDGPLPSAQQIRENLAYLTPPSLEGGFVIHEPATPWASRHSEEVVRFLREHNPNMRQLIGHFRVSPQAIREALARHSVMPAE